MLKTLKWLVVILAALVVLPPLWFLLVPPAPGALPEPGVAVRLDNGLSLNVLDSGGTGPVLVLVHGLPGSAYDWRSLTPELERRGFRTVAIDRSGYGHSQAHRGTDFTLARNVDDLNRLLDALDLSDVTIVGWSYGGAMAMTAAGNDRVSRLVLVGTGGPQSDADEPPEPSTAIRILYSRPVLAWRRAVPPVSEALQSVLSEQAFSGGLQPDWWLQDLAAGFERADTLLTYRNEILAPIAADGFDPAAIELPVLLLHGDDDRLAPVGIGRYLANRLPNATYVEVASGSHMLPVTHAAFMAERIADWHAAVAAAPQD